MKPKDLKVPFPWKESYTTIVDRVFYNYPNIEKAFEFPGWESNDLFNNKNAIKVEYCSGNGKWVAEQAKKDLSTNWVAVERRFMRCKKIWSKVKNESLPNLVIVNGEALETTQSYFPSSSISEVFINFPDPWPKTKHAKFRLIKKAFTDELYRILVPGGRVTVVTDDFFYATETVSHFLECGLFSPHFSFPHYVIEWEGYGTSYFEDLWRKKGKEIRYMTFCKG